ncbi:MAG TPA: CoA-binding protein [Rhodobacterales bacterium]|nr:CoA-binding protein [Rhodobacterales bacterium]
MTQYSDDHFRNILDTTRVIALVGFSNKPERASHKVAAYLAEHGYRVIPVNPGLAGQSFMGEEVVASLADIPKDAGVDMLDVFRASDHVPPIVQTALEELPGLKTIWLQIGVISEAAKAIADARGLAYVENHCPKIEHARLMA